MTSQALVGLLAGVQEVRALRAYYPVPRRGIATGIEATAVKAHGRASVVLLSSHFERYFYALNEQAIQWLNLQGCTVDRFPEQLLLLHSKQALDEVAEMAWERRAGALRDFVAHQGPLWGAIGVPVILDAEPLLAFMKAPNPKTLKRFFKLYGVEDIFASTTYKAHTRSDYYLTLNELVDKRNNIAHGNAQTEALPLDITHYLDIVERFCRSADKRMGRTLKGIAQSQERPW